MTIKPKSGPKKDPRVSTNDKKPIWLKSGSQKIPIKKPKKMMINAVFFKLSLDGKRFIREF